MHHNKQLINKISSFGYFAYYDSHFEEEHVSWKIIFLNIINVCNDAKAVFNRNVLLVFGWHDNDNDDDEDEVSNRSLKLWIGRLIKRNANRITA